MAQRPPHSPTPVPVLTVPGAAGAKANSCSDVLRQFLFLTIVHDEKSLEFSGNGWVLSANIELKGTGGALAMHAKDELNRIKKPFAITWRRNDGATKWVIATVAQPELDF